MNCESYVNKSPVLFLEEANNATYPGMSLIDNIPVRDKALTRTRHFIWGALTLLTETLLPIELRYNGYQALLWYDTLENSTDTMPENISNAVRSIVHALYFRNFREEQVKIWQCSDAVKLLTLYKRVAILFAEPGMDKERRKMLAAYTMKLADSIYDIYGDLNIVQVAHTICENI